MSLLKKVVVSVERISRDARKALRVKV